MSGRHDAPPPAATRGPAAWEALARAAAARKPERTDAGLRRELLLVSLAGDPYALPVERVREIVRLRPITPLPRVCAAILGVIALRGEILQVIDLRRRLALPAAAPDLQARIVVLHGEDGQATGFRVDAVREVLRVSEQNLRAPANGESEAIAGLCLHAGEFVSILDVDRALELGDSG
jgi:purine-binding chemotaxis protein CheW